VGLGLLIAEWLAVDSELILSVEGHEILLQVKWSKPEPADHQLFRYGLSAPSDGVDLEELFFSYGCLEENLDDNDF
jgi:hypothetical protein